MKLCANWLPISPALTREVARRAELSGLWGLGVGDSPRYGELYSACTDALAVTDRLTVLTSVTNPVTRHESVHMSAARALRSHGGRFGVGVGRGDSAVRTFGLMPAPLADVEHLLGHLRAEVPGTYLLFAAAGPRAAEAAGRVADGLIAGTGRDLLAMDTLRRRAGAARTGAGRPGPVEVWGSVRLAVARDRSEVPALRRSMLPRAISASRFNFAGTFAGKNVPEEFQAVLRERYAAYDFAWHGSSGRSPVAGLFEDRPDIEEYLLDRFAVVGTAEQCHQQIGALAPAVDGLFLSILFENALEQLDLLRPVALDLAGAA
ncbi:LLM class flavin-dependent oxidoreductase [Streptomyces sp. CBMA29]|uniref:LLM class flavin-dependent oxidoreductase n=1 Tax=Streptomyces sp. CBMA29 TaxID=1896314 RepID=UPI0016621AEC|nr:LLM class flavin-dependent oxidoreductase [Streptomyces sp. CBMA29]MBD0736703.1 hypothetical protein [Streptomyces sp. CBMA29]